VKRRVLAGCEMSGRVAGEFAKLGWEAVSADILPSEAPDCSYRRVSRSEGGWDFLDGEFHGSYRHYQGDVRDLFSWDHPVNAARRRERDTAGILRECPVPLFDLAVLFPPCTHLSQAGAVWWKYKDATRGGDGRMQEGAAFFMEMVDAPARYVAVENPVGVMGLPSQACYYRRPDQVVQPHMFGDPLVKATCVWLEHGLPPLYADNPVEPTGRVATGGGSWRTDQKHGRGANNGHEDAKGRVNRQRERNRTLPGLARAMAEQWTRFIACPELSSCCGARVTVEGRTTRYWKCSGCGQACDLQGAL
jgi:hypothetical protein